MAKSGNKEQRIERIMSEFAAVWVEQTHPEVDYVRRLGMYLPGYGVSYHWVPIGLIYNLLTSEDIDTMSTPIVIPELPGNVVVVSPSRLGQVLGVIGAINQFDIADDADCIKAREFLKTASSLRKQVETDRKSAAKPFNDVADLVYASAKTVIDPLDTVIALLKTKLADYINRVNEARSLADLQARQQAERISNGDQTRLAPAIVVPDPSSDPLVNSSLPVATRTTKRAEILDRALVPDKYKVIDLNMVEADLKMGIEVPGARLVDHTIVVSR